MASRFRWLNFFRQIGRHWTYSLNFRNNLSQLHITLSLPWKHVSFRISWSTLLLFGTLAFCITCLTFRLSQISLNLLSSSSLLSSSIWTASFSGYQKNCHQWGTTSTFLTTEDGSFLRTLKTTFIGLENMACHLGI